MKLVVLLIVIVVGMWLYGTYVAEDPNKPAYSIATPQDSIASFFRAVKKNDAKGVEITCQDLGYGMAMMKEINSYVTPAIDQMGSDMPMQVGKDLASGSSIIIGTDGRLVTTLHFEIKKLAENQWKIVGLSTVGGTPREALKK